MTLEGRRLDAAGQFRQRFDRLGPSVIDVPAPGCWRLSLSAETAKGSVTVKAVDG
jgi:hypothetical protein